MVRTGSSKTSWQMEQLRCLLIELGLMNILLLLNFTNPEKLLITFTILIQIVLLVLRK